MKPISGARELLGADVPAREETLVDRVYRRYWRSLCTYVRRKYGAGPPDPEEVAQAAFVRFASLERPADIHDPQAFLMRCATNIVLDHRRHEGVRSGAHADLLRAAQEEQAADFSPECLLLARERLALLESVIARMPPLRRRVFLLVRAEGMKSAEVARLCGIAERTVYQHVFRAMKDCEAAFAAAEKEWGKSYGA